MKYLNKLTLGRKIYLLLALGLVIGISVFSLLGTRAINQSTEAMLEDRLTTARVVAGYLDDILGHALEELGISSRAISANRADGAATAAEVRKLEETYSRLSLDIHSTYIVNGQGRVVWSQSGFPANPGAVFPDYPGGDNILRDGPTGISGLVNDPVTGTPVILFVSKLTQEEAREELVVAIDIAETSIGSFVRPIQLGETGYVEIVDQNGIVVARTLPGPELDPFEKSDHSGRFADLIAAGQPARGTCHTCHESTQTVQTKDVLAFVPLSAARWGVVIRQSEKEALAPIHELRQNIILFAAILTVIATATVIITTRDVISRLKVLSAATRTIAAGNLDSTVTVTRHDEVGMLAESFEDMRVKLKTNYRELEQRTDELSYLLSVSETLSNLPGLSDLDTVLRRVTDRTLEIMKETAAGILLYDEGQTALYCQVNRGLYRNRAQHFPVKLDDGINTRAARTGKVVTSEDFRNDSRFSGGDQRLNGDLRGFISVPILSEGNILGVINVASRETRRFSVGDIRLLEGIARQIARTIENARLQREVKLKEEIRGELLQDMFAIQEEERKRIARELHDETSQVVASLNASLETAAMLLPADTGKAGELLDKARSLAVNILENIHRLIYELRPSLLDDLGLVSAARWLADANLETTGINISVKTYGRQRRLEPGTEATLFRLIQEAVTNIARHSLAKTASIRLHFKENAIKINIKDDGQGFDVDEAISSRDRPRGLGLVGMKERVAIANGKIKIRSHPGGGGTMIQIDIPLEKEENEDNDEQD